MRKTDVLRFFGGGDARGAKAKTARALGITKSAVTAWPDIIPESAAYRVESVSGSALRVDPKVYERLAQAGRGRRAARA